MEKMVGTVGRLAVIYFLFSASISFVYGVIPIQWDLDISIR